MKRFTLGVLGVSGERGFERRYRLALALPILLLQTAVAASTADASVTGEKVAAHGGGLSWSSEDGEIEIGLAGRIFLDWNLIETNSQFDESRPGLEGSGAEIRSARLRVEGRVYQIVSYRVEYDFERRNPTAQDVWIGLAVIPRIGRLRFGHMKEPFSLTAMTDGTDIIFMERALPAEAFAPGRNVGIALSNSLLDDRMTWQFGAFQVTDDFAKGFADGSAHDVTARLTGLAWYADEGRKLLHLGLSYSHQFRSRDSPVRFQSRPETHLTSVRTVDTGSFDADDVDLLTPELALMFGRVLLQAEYFYVPVKRSGVKDLNYDGFYITLSIFVLEGRRPYNMREGYFGRVVPAQNFRPTRPGWGALELAGRISELDTNGPSLKGGKELNFTFGANWYLNPNARIMLNYIRASEDDRPDGRNGDLHVVQTRVQVDF